TDSSLLIAPHWAFRVFASTYKIRPYMINLKELGEFEAAVVEEREFFVHPSSYVDEPCTIGNGTNVWHFCHVMANCSIVDRCNSGKNGVISPGVVIGNNVKIQNNVSVYSGVVLEDDVFCGPSMVFTNVDTPRSAYPRNTPEHYLKTTVKRGASIGAN